MNRIRFWSLGSAVAAEHAGKNRVDVFDVVTKIEQRFEFGV